MTLQGLFTDTADIQTYIKTNVGGKVSLVWNHVSTIACRITKPNPSKIIVAGVNITPKTDAVIFASMAVLDCLEELPLPVRFYVLEGANAGIYEMQNPPRPYPNSGAASHVEIDTARVNND